MNKTVSVNEKLYPISFYNRSQQLVALGDIVTADYQGENLAQIFFRPSSSNPFVHRKSEAKDYLLGRGSARLTAVNPADIQEYFMHKGFTVADAWSFRAGGMLSATLINTSVSYDNYITYDQQFWGDALGVLHPGVKLTFNFMVGAMGVSVQEGLYKTNCSNSLMSDLLGLSVVTRTHSSYQLMQLLEEIASRNFSVFEVAPTGPQMTTSSILQNAYNLLKAYAEEQLNPEKGISDRFTKLREYFRIFRPQALQPWVLRGFVEQLNVMLQDYAGSAYARPIYAMDMLNLYTNSVNLHRVNEQNDLGVWRAMSACDQVIKDTILIADMSTIFQTVKE